MFKKRNLSPILFFPWTPLISILRNLLSYLKNSPPKTSQLYWRVFLLRSKRIHLLNLRKHNKKSNSQTDTKFHVSFFLGGLCENYSHPEVLHVKGKLSCTNVILIVYLLTVYRDRLKLGPSSRFPVMTLLNRFNLVCNDFAVLQLSPCA